MDRQKSQDIMQAGTGFMICLTDTIRILQNRGYRENLVPCFDHLPCRSDAIKLYPKDFVVEDKVRFENSSDPSDQSILYIVSSKNRNIRGLYVEAYGTYHDELSPQMLERLKCHRGANQPDCLEIIREDQEWENGYRPSREAFG